MSGSAYEYYTRQRSYMAMATGLSTWRNGDAALTSGQLKAIDDQLEAANIGNNKKVEERKRTIGSGGKVNKTHEKVFAPGDFESPFDGQTAKLIYPSLGNCSTVGTDHQTGLTVSGVAGDVVTVSGESWTPDEHIDRMVEVTAGDDSGSKYTITDNGTDTLTVSPTPPANLNGDTIKITKSPFTHTITPLEGQVPPYIAFHVEREMTTDNRRYDLLGMIVENYSWVCEDEGVVSQNVKAKVAFCKRDSTNDIAMPNKLTDNTFTWDNLKAGGITFNYQGNPIDADVYRVEILFTRTYFIGLYDSTKYASVGLFKTWDFEIKLTVRPKDEGNESLFEINELFYSEYAAGSIDFIGKWQRSATDYVQWAATDMDMDHFDENISNEEQDFEEYEIILRPSSDSTSGLIVTAVDVYNVSHFEVT